MSEVVQVTKEKKKERKREAFKMWDVNSSQNIFNEEIIK